MRAHRTALLCLAAALTMASDGVLAQKMGGRGPSPNIGMSKPPTVPDGPRGGGGYPGGGHRGPGWGGVVPGIIVRAAARLSARVRTLLMTARQGRAARSSEPPRHKRRAACERAPARAG